MLALAIAATVRIGVFGLFHPVQLDVTPVPGNLLIIESNGHKQVLDTPSSVRLHAPARVTGRDGSETAFILSVPGRGALPRIIRIFHGRLEVLQQGGHLIAVVQMDRETAVASIIAAEGSLAVPMEAQKAQAVVARSFLAAARGRHADFDFCDTTHCQFLRDPPGPRTLAFRAAAQTQRQMLTYQGRVIAALYSADCGGHTRTLEEAGWVEPGWVEAGRPPGYPFFSVDCPVHSPVSGHRLGMCQVGAAELARRRSTYPEILLHYFPATTIEHVDTAQFIGAAR